MAKTTKKATATSNQYSVASHLIRFIGLNAGLSLVPLAASVMARQLAEVAAPAGAYAPELLFFSVATCATALGDLTDEKYTEGIKWLFDLLKVILILGIALSALLFGFYQYEGIIGPGNTRIQNNITPLAIWVAIASFAVCLIAELIIARIRGK